jgi:hypothetical protein
VYKRGNRDLFLILRIQLTNWLRIRLLFNRGSRIYYGDPPFKGTGYLISGLMDIQPTKNLNLYFDYNLSDYGKTTKKYMM